MPYVVTRETLMAQAETWELISDANFLPKFKSDGAVTLVGNEEDQLQICAIARTLSMCCQALAELIK